VLATGDTLEVALAGGMLRVMRLQAAGGKKVSAAEFVEALGVKTGDRFENGVVPAQ
jgi:hypothetical protein